MINQAVNSATLVDANVMLPMLAQEAELDPALFSMGVLIATAIIGFLFFVFSLVVMCMVCKRLGHSPWFGLIAIIPLGGLFLMLFWAFAQSPNEKKIKALKRELRQLAREKEELQVQRSFPGQGYAAANYQPQRPVPAPQQQLPQQPPHSQPVHYQPTRRTQPSKHPAAQAMSKEKKKQRPTGEAVSPAPKKGASKPNVAPRSAAPQPKRAASTTENIKDAKPRVSPKHAPARPAGSEQGAAQRPAAPTSMPAKPKRAPAPTQQSAAQSASGSSRPKRTKPTPKRADAPAPPAPAEPPKPASDDPADALGELFNG